MIVAIRLALFSGSFLLLCLFCCLEEATSTDSLELSDSALTGFSSFRFRDLVTGPCMGTCVSIFELESEDERELKYSLTSSSPKLKALGDPRESFGSDDELLLLAGPARPGESAVAEAPPEDNELEVERLCFLRCANLAPPTERNVNGDDNCWESSLSSAFSHSCLKNSSAVSLEDA